MLLNAGLIYVAHLLRGFGLPLACVGPQLPKQEMLIIFSVTWVQWRWHNVWWFSVILLGDSHNNFYHLSAWIQVTAFLLCKQKSVLCAGTRLCCLLWRWAGNAHTVGCLLGCPLWQCFYSLLYSSWVLFFWFCFRKRRAQVEIRDHCKILGIAPCPLNIFLALLDCGNLGMIHSSWVQL